MERAANPFNAANGPEKASVGGRSCKGLLCRRSVCNTGNTGGRGTPSAGARGGSPSPGPPTPPPARFDLKDRRYGNAVACQKVTVPRKCGKVGIWWRRKEGARVETARRPVAEQRDAGLSRMDCAPAGAEAEGGGEPSASAENRAGEEGWGLDLLGAGLIIKSCFSAG